MKKVLSLVLALVMLLPVSVTALAMTGESGPYNPVTLDEIQKGTVIAFDSVEGAFNTTTYYVKILCEDDEEYIYALSDGVYLGDVRYEAAEIADMDLGEITFVLRNEKLKYINPVMPDGLFESLEVLNCYKNNDTIYAIVEFENLVGEFKLIMAAYSGDMLCSVKSFDISYMDSYYELDMPAKGGEKVKLFYWEDVAGLKPLCETFAEVVDKGITAFSPMMIVASRVVKSNGEVYLKGYKGTSYSLSTVYVDTEETKLLPDVGRGDVIRYKTNSSNEIIDYRIWYDANSPVQEESCASVDEAISKRILEIKATSTAPVVNYPDATFRLQYGTVSSITLSKEGDTICVTPTIVDDNCEMAYEGNGVIEWEIENIVKVFEYDKEEVLAEADLEDIVPGKTEVIAYSSQGQLRMLYIVKKPYISEKKIMTVQKGTETVDGYKITGYSEGKEVVFMVDATKEPVIKEVYTGRIIAYVPDGKTIKDIEIVFEGTHEGFKPEDGESLIAKDTKETLVFGLSEYTTDGAVINGVKYTVTEDTNYLLVKYAGNIVNYGLGKHMEMKNEYVLIRVKANKPTEIADVVIFQELN